MTPNGMAFAERGAVALVSRRTLKWSRCLAVTGGKRQFWERRVWGKRGESGGVSRIAVKLTDRCASFYVGGGGGNGGSVFEMNWRVCYKYANRVFPLQQLNSF